MRPLHAAVAFARRILWFFARPFVIAARAITHWGTRHGRGIVNRVRAARAEVAASIRATVRAARAGIRRSR